MIIDARSDYRSITFLSVRLSYTENNIKYVLFLYSHHNSLFNVYCVYRTYRSFIINFIALRITNFRYLSSFYIATILLIVILFNSLFFTFWVSCILPCCVEDPHTNWNVYNLLRTEMFNLLNIFNVYIVLCSYFCLLY